MASRREHGAGRARAASLSLGDGDRAGGQSLNKRSYDVENLIFKSE